MQNNITSCWLTNVCPPISEATSQIASENDSSSDTEDPFASTDEDEGELDEDEIVLEDALCTGLDWMHAYLYMAVYVTCTCYDVYHTSTSVCALV